MKNVFIFIILFLIVYLFYLIFVISNKKALEKLKNGKELVYLEKTYKLNYKLLNIKSIARALALVNSFILSFTTTLVCFLNDWINNFYLWLLASLIMSIVILFPLIIILYNMLGNYFKKKQNKVKE